MEPNFLNIEKQLDLLYRRGIEISDKERNLEKLRHISYYRVKEFAAPFASIKMYGEVPVLKYKNISFDGIVRRYYQDKNLRINLLHAIEKIEVSLKRNISYILGEKYGAYGYLNFSLWANKQKYSVFELETEQFYFKKDLKKTVKKSSLIDLKEPKNHNADGFPTIWLMTEILMFGNLVYMIEIMSKKNQRKLAKFYNCSVDELISWMKCLNFVRNVCAHNSNIIDIELQTKPKIRKSWKGNYLKTVRLSSGKYVLTNRLSVVILITITLVREINEKYDWKKIRSNLASICKDKDPVRADKNAELLGFVNSNDALDLQYFSRMVR